MFGSALFASLPIGAGTGAPEYLGGHTLVLVEERANEITVPYILAGGVNTRVMEWDTVTNQWVGAAAATRISEFCKQVNQRILGDPTLNNAVIVRAETVDADTGNRFVFTPGATPVGSLQDFEVVIQDQDGDYESRGFLMFLQPDANPDPGIDGGDVLLRLSPLSEPW